MSDTTSLLRRRPLATGPKPSKPSIDFPLFAHSSGKWGKRIGGKIRYFGRWDNPTGALAEYELFLATRKPAAASGCLTVQEAANQFLSAKDEAVSRGELSARSFAEYVRTCKRFVAHAGPGCDIVSQISPATFASYKAEMGKKWNVVALGNEITRVRSLFRWCYESRLIKERTHFGPDFKKAGAKVLRKHRRLAGKKLFSSEEIRRLLDYSGIQMRAMELLGINCGYGPTDCATLPLSAIDGGWIRYPRHKTEVERDCPLWPETAAALQAVIAARYAPQDEAAELVFVQPDGRSWNTSSNPICKQFRQVYCWAGVKRAGFYWLRHTFETIGGGAKDQIAVNCLMGHADSSMAAVYREEVAIERLIAVTDHVRRWLFG